MTIAILPARLANQIAAGEVVERPASVIKELVENALDAGATAIHIDVDKGGVKKIRVSDDGCGIAKDELTLALSRHATSKIKDLTDLEAINSLGFRGEALASISSVARLTLTSKPKEQATAWQANAAGRDMAVTIKPAAHPNGTSIEALDLFFNTPARRKFLRTEKTEFNHIEEVVRRIALARFDVAFSLTHNGKMVRQYRVASNDAQKAKRVAMVCGQKFIDNALIVNCQHDDMHFSGWLAKPNFVRSQNDLCYSYVNGRMMRDKLINHAIRQAYAELLPPDTYPAFVLFLTVDFSDVDVNVHPAKHEVRFHQSRYVHDFIYSVCHQALLKAQPSPESDVYPDNELSPQIEKSVAYQRPDYVKPLQQVADASIPKKQSYNPYNSNNYGSDKSAVSQQAANNYQQLMTPLDTIHAENSATPHYSEHHSKQPLILAVEQGRYGIIKQPQGLCLLSLAQVSYTLQKELIKKSWYQGELGLVSQPLLLPILLSVDDAQVKLVIQQHKILQCAGIMVEVEDKKKLKIRQYPAILRDNDVTHSFFSLLDIIDEAIQKSEKPISDDHFIQMLAKIKVNENYDEDQAHELWYQAKNQLSKQIIDDLLLNCIALDLTSEIKQLESNALY